MHKDKSWQYNEFKQIGKDYTKQEEVDVYDSSHTDFRNVKEENDKILKILQVQSNDVIIDFGSGTGTFAIQAAQQCGKIIAVDVSETMINFAKSKAHKAGQSNIEFYHSGFLSYKHLQDPVDAIVINLSFHHLPDFWKGIALKRIYHILKPAGKLLIRDVVVEDEKAMERIETFIKKQAEAGGDFLREDAEEHFREEFSTYDWIIEGLLKRAGFSIKSKDMDGGVFFSYLCTKT